MNGRARGDEEGSVTYVGPRGSSVIDYVITKKEGDINAIRNMRIDKESTDRTTYQ